VFLESLLFIIPRMVVGCKVDLMVPLQYAQFHYELPFIDKVGQQFALDVFVTHTHTHGTKYWSPGIKKLETDLTTKLAVSRV